MKMNFSTVMILSMAVIMLATSVVGPFLQG